MKTQSAVLVMVFPFFWCACSGAGGLADGSMDGSQDAADGSKQDGADHSGGDYNLEGDCGIDVAAGLCACSQSWVRANDPGEALRQKARITFRPGLVRLLRNEESFEVDWIDQLEIGADAEQATPAGVGRFQRTILQGTVDDGYVQFVFKQVFQAGGETFELVFTSLFEIEGGRPIHPVLVLDRAVLDHPYSFGSSWEYSLGVHSGDGSDQRVFSSCGLASGSCQVFELGIEGEDSLKLESCRYCPLQDVICKEDLAVIRRALFTGAGGQAEVDDHFRLCQSMVHHNWGTDIVIAFEEPLSQTHGLYLGSIDEFYPGPDSFDEVHYLDANLASYQTKAVTSFEILDSF